MKKTVKQNRTILTAEETEYINKIIKKYGFKKTTVIQNVLSSKTYEAFKSAGHEISYITNLGGNEYSERIDLDNNRELEKVSRKYVSAEPVLFILDHILEKLNDPRNLLRVMKDILFANPANRVQIFTKSRDNFGIEYPADESSYREWKLNELQLFLVSGGFKVKECSEIGGQIYFELSIDVKGI